MNWVTRVLQIPWGIYVWLCFSLACVFSLLVTVFIPGAGRRARWVTWAARMTFILSFIRVRIQGLDHISSGGCVVVANHASYIDGVLLKGYLPSRFGFVIKGEMRSVPIVHFLLRRSGAKFVERKNAGGSSRDARTLVKAAQRGESLGFFPEGTFVKQAGLARFRPGAFVAAIKADIPVVPVAIRGTRAMLPARQFIPRKTDLQVDILAPISPTNAAFTSHRVLAAESRQRILAVLDEPDLELAKQ